MFKAVIAQTWSLFDLGVPHVNEIVNPVHRLAPEQTTKFLVSPGPGMQLYGEDQELGRRAGLTRTSAIVHDASGGGAFEERQWSGAASGIAPAVAAAATGDVAVLVSQTRNRRLPSSSSRSTGRSSRHAKSPCRKLTSARAMGMGASSASRWSGSGRAHHQHQHRASEMACGTDRVCIFEFTRGHSLICCDTLVKRLRFSFRQPEITNFLLRPGQNQKPENKTKIKLP